MSDIANTSITSEISPPIHCSTFRQNIEKEDVLRIKKDAEKEDVLRMKNDEREAPKSEVIMNNLKTNTDNNAETNLINMNNNNNLLNTKNRSGCTENGEYRDENENKLTKLKIVITSPEHDYSNVINVVRNDLSKFQSPIVERNSAEFVMDVKGKESTPIKSIKHNRPIMGRKALLNKANIDTNDSLIVHDLINEKYNGVLNHYIDRMSQRRRSRLGSSQEFYSDTLFSSPPNGSPLSVSSINTPNSIPPDEKAGFQFPVNAQSPDYRFLVSTDDTNIETTTDGPDESTINSIDNTNEKSTTSASEYDPKKFLENAIGEVTNLCNISAYNSNVMSKENNPQQPDDYSVGTLELSTLISRASTLYNSLKRNVKKRHSIKMMAPSADSITKKKNESSGASHNTKIEDLMRQLSIQNEILFQVSKALQYCKKTKEFQGSTELIEAEKILLVATCTKEVLTAEIYNAEDNIDRSNNKQRSCGLVEICDLKFPLKTKKCTHHRDLTEHFLVLLSCGTKVQASDVVVADDNGTVNIKKCFKFTKLPTDFEIGLSVYSMKVANRIHHSHECRSLSPKNLFHLQWNSKKNTVSNDIFIRPSSFSLRGKYEIRSAELSKVKQTGDLSTLTLTMHHTPLTSSLSRTFSMNIRSEIKLTNKMNGFLTIGVNNEHGCTIWNRRWCVLDGSILRYWNYPSEEVVNPLGNIDLSYCLDQEILAADRNFCARPRTLTLAVQSKEILKKYLLSADNCEDLKQWQNELNYVITSMRVWNCLNID